MDKPFNPKKRLQLSQRIRNEVKKLSREGVSPEGIAEDMALGIDTIKRILGLNTRDSIRNEVYNADDDEDAGYI